MLDQPIRVSGYGSLRRRSALLFCACLSLIVGCGKSGRLETYQTAGTVMFVDGEAVEEGGIILSATGLPPARGVIENGRFSLMTYETGDGAVAGKFKVAVRVNPPMDYDPDAGKPPPLGAKSKYERPETSGIEFEVTTEGDNVLDIVLERGS